MSKVDNMIPESGSIIKSITSIANDINLEYRTSKLPKFIKDIRYKKYMKDLSKYIVRINDIKRIDFGLIREFVGLYLDDFDKENSDCKGCKMIGNNTDNIQATFIFPIMKSEEEMIGKVVVTFITHLDSFDILYAVYQGKEEKGKYTKEDIKDITVSSTNKYFTEEDISKPKAIVNIIFKGVINNIIKYLNEYIERLERIL